MSGDAGEHFRRLWLRKLGWMHEAEMLSPAHAERIREGVRGSEREGMAQAHDGRVSCDQQPTAVLHGQGKRLMDSTVLD